MRSCPSTTERVPSRSVSRRNFNTLVYLTNVRLYASFSLFFSLTLPLLLLLLLQLLLLRRLFRFFSSVGYSPDAFSSLALTCSFFRGVSSGSLSIQREENSFAAKEEPGEDTSCETGIGNLLSVKQARSPATLSRTKLLTDPWCLDRSRTWDACTLGTKLPM